MAGEKIRQETQLPNTHPTLNHQSQPENRSSSPDIPGLLRHGAAPSEASGSSLFLASLFYGAETWPPAVLTRNSLTPAMSTLELSPDTLDARTDQHQLNILVSLSPLGTAGLELSAQKSRGTGRPLDFNPPNNGSGVLRPIVTM